MARGKVGSTGIIGDPWHRCMRCDCERRVSDLVWQNGLLICRETGNCFDNPDTWTRDPLIAEILSEVDEEAAVAHVLRGDSNEPEPPQP